MAGYTSEEKDNAEPAFPPRKPPNTTEVPNDLLRTLQPFLHDVAQYFQARDRMNAIIHQDLVKWSPLTNQAEMLTQLFSAITPAPEEN